MKNDTTINIKNIIIIFINVIYILAFGIWAYASWNNEFIIENYENWIFIWIIPMIIVQLLSFVLKKIKTYDFVLWFTLLSYLFMFGRIFIKIFALNNKLAYDPYIYYNDSILFHSYIYAIMSLILISFGYTLFFPSKSLVSNELAKINIDFNLYKTGKWMFVLGFVSKIINDAKIISILQTTKSYVSYATAVSSGIFDDISYLTLPGAFLMFFSGCMKEKRKKIMFILLLAYFFLLMLLTGSRKIQLFSIITLFLGYRASECKNKKVNIFKTVLSMFLGLFIINTLVIIRNNRFSLGNIFNQLTLNFLSFNTLKNLFGELCAESSMTLLTVASTIKTVPSILEFEYGKTLLRTIPSFLPIGWLVGDFFNKATATYVINGYTKIPVGSSLIATLYWNWGYIGGWIFAFIFGALVSKININKNDIKINQREKMGMYFAIFSYLIILVRSDIFDIYRGLCYLFISKYVIQKIIQMKGAIKWI